MGAKVPLMVAQASEANTATDETPAKAYPYFNSYRLHTQEGEK
jgi:hypothetical protein